MLPFAGTDIKAVDEDAVFLLAKRDRAEAAGTRRIAAVLNDMLESLLSNGYGDDALWAALSALETTELQAAVLSVLMGGVQIGAEAGALHLAEISLAVDQAEVLAAASEWAAAHAGTQIRLIDETTRRQVRAALSSWLESGAGNIDDLTAALEPTFGKARAENIARTETTSAFQKGYEETARAAGVREFEWYTMRDELVCPICQPMHGATRFIDGLYAAEMIDAGGVRNPPPAHPRCRCGERGLLGTIGE